MDDHEKIERLFRAFAQAVSTADLRMLQALCVRDAAVSSSLLMENVSGRPSLKIRAIEQEGDLATVRFTADDDEAELTVTREGADWRIREI